MNIAYLELSANDLQAQHNFYSNVLELPVILSATKLEVQEGETKLVFTKASPDFDGAYHFAFNIPENQFNAAQAWISNRCTLMHDETGQVEFDSESRNSHSVYFKDAAGNVLEFIARHNLRNATVGAFDSSQILNVSGIGLPSEDVIAFAEKLCVQLELSAFKQEQNATFTPVGDDNGLFILPVQDRIWIPNSSVPAKLLPVKVIVAVKNKAWTVRGVPYQITSLV